MARVAVPEQRQVTRPVGGIGRLLLLACCLPATGCASLASCVGPGDGPPAGPVRDITVVWEPHVFVTHDTVHDGKPQPALAGRLFLFAPDGLPVAGDGEVLVQLYADDIRGPDGQAKELEKWLFHSAQLKLLLQKDTIGWGYTLVLPWGTYDPAIGHVHLMAAYQVKGKAPLFAPSGPLNLHQPPPAAATTRAPTPPPRMPPAPAAQPAGAWTDGGRPPAQLVRQAENLTMPGR
jgi:hypothetical protein